jgi:hypothetical protein
MLCCLVLSLSCDGLLCSAQTPRDADPKVDAWSKSFGAALLCNTTLHTFYHGYIMEAPLKDALQRNHSIIACDAQWQFDFSDVLLFNRVSKRPCDFSDTLFDCPICCH